MIKVRDFFPPPKETTYEKDEVRDPDPRERCIVCGFVNLLTAVNCAFCESNNWNGQYTGRN